jgi:hypothetical protein
LALSNGLDSILKLEIVNKKHGIKYNFH